MSRLIDADALKNAFSNMYRKDYERWIKEVIDNTPTVEQSPVIGEVISFVERDSRPKGKWTYIGISEVTGLKICKCSVCNKRTYGSQNFCPNCGARMEK